jgi:two-component system NtrC family sensor kinase
LRELLEKITTITNQTQRASQITKNLLDVSRKKSSEREPTDVHKLIEQVLAYTEYRAHAQGLKVVRDFEPTLPRISVDPRRVEQIFLNLILNAYHAMARGGTLTITARQVQREMGSVLQLAFADNGHGIAEEHLKEIFDPFFSTKAGSGGTGLGLFISQKIVESYNGTIEVKSEEKKGTTFTVEFPALKG